MEIILKTKVYTLLCTDLDDTTNYHLYNDHKFSAVPKVPKNHNEYVPKQNKAAVD